MSKNWIVKKVNKKYILRAGTKVFECQVGGAGLKTQSQKKEGDRATPIGKWKLLSVYYRSKKVMKPLLKSKKLKINKITERCGWCDDHSSRYYNKYINIKKISIEKLGFEKLWREDDAYDLIIETSHNTKPITKNKGSAIFIHCSFSDLRNTAGCIALKKNALMFLINKIKNEVFVEIKNNF